MKNLVSIIALGVLLTGCETTKSLGSRMAGPNIQKEAVELSHAHRDVTNSIIFSAILESRDRGVSNLSTMSGITSTPTVTSKGGLTIAALPLGAAFEPV